MILLCAAFFCPEFHQQNSRTYAFQVLSKDFKFIVSCFLFSLTGERKKRREHKEEEEEPKGKGKKDKKDGGKKGKKDKEVSEVYVK